MSTTTSLSRLHSVNFVSVNRNTIQWIKTESCITSHPLLVLFPNIWDFLPLSSWESPFILSPTSRLATLKPFCRSPWNPRTPRPYEIQQNGFYPLKILYKSLLVLSQLGMSIYLNELSPHSCLSELFLLLCFSPAPPPFSSPPLTVP